MKSGLGAGSGRGYPLLPFCLCMVVAASRFPQAGSMSASLAVKPPPAAESSAVGKSGMAPAPPRSDSPPTPSAAANPNSAQPGKPAGTQPAKAAVIPAKSRISDTQKDFCNFLWGCSLPVPNGYCPDPSALQKPRFSYDSARCREGRTLNARGVGPSHPLFGYNLYRFLGMEYRILYTVEEELPISEARLAYLLTDLPLSAHLVSQIRKEPYTAEYTDPQRTHFKGTKGKRLRGDAALISGSTEEKRLFYFGYGVATLAWWTLRGPVLMEFSYVPSEGKRLKYKMKLLVFPGNGMINGIMNLGLFKKVVLGKVKEVLTDITQTAQMLSDGGSVEILASKDWTPEEKRKIAEFLKLP
jgi:hypothetical protein